MAVYEAETPTIIVYTDSEDNLENISPDLLAIKLIIVTSTGAEYILPPGGTLRPINSV